ncbi:MAG: hypothetical protein RQ753_03760 [Desulfurivibrionaceae bacterium]|nr:hypothetical protein [Desulfurivibrionaceae bacterium]
MKEKKNSKASKSRLVAEKNEKAMIAGILEGSPDGIGVAVIRLECGCRKMAAVDKEGEPASKIVAYRDSAMSICDKCKKDHGDFSRVTEAFIDWVEPGPDAATRKKIEVKVLGNYPQA